MKQIQYACSCAICRVYSTSVPMNVEEKRSEGHWSPSFSYCHDYKKSSATPLCVLLSSIALSGISYRHPDNAKDNHVGSHNAFTIKVSKPIWILKKKPTRKMYIDLNHSLNKFLFLLRLLLHIMSNMSTIFFVSLAYPGKSPHQELLLDLAGFHSKCHLDQEQWHPDALSIAGKRWKKDKKNQTYCQVLRFTHCLFGR